MKSFGSVLQKCINSQNMSTSLLAKNVGMNRGWLYNVFSGKKKLPEDKFQEILRNEEFTVRNIEILREAYYREEYGSVNYDKVLYILRFLSGDDVKDRSDIPIAPDCPNVLEISSCCLIDEEKVPDVIKYMIKTELAENNDPVFYSNMPYSMEQFDDAIYASVANEDRPIEFHRIVRFENDADGTLNLKNVLMSLRYLRLRQSIWCYYADDNVGFPYDAAVYPYYLITSSAALLYSVDGKENLFLRNRDAACSIRRVADKKILHCKPLAQYPKNIFELKELAIPTTLKGAMGYMQMHPCWGYYADYEILQKIIEKNLPEREAVVKVAADYFSALYNMNVAHYTTLSGAKEFIRTGRVYEAGTDLVPALAPEHRVYFMEKLTAMFSDPSQVIFMLDEEKVRIPAGFEISFAQNCIILLGLVSKEPQGYYGEYFVAIKDKGIIRDFQNFQNYLKSNDFFLTKETALLYLNDLLSVYGTPPAV